MAGFELALECNGDGTSLKVTSLEPLLLSNPALALLAALSFDSDASEKRNVEMARDLTRKFANRLKEAPGDTPHDMAFLTVMSAVKDVARHLENIAERNETERI